MKRCWVKNGSTKHRILNWNFFRSRVEKYHVNYIVKMETVVVVWLRQDSFPFRTDFRYLRNSRWNDVYLETCECSRRFMQYNERNTRVEGLCACLYFTADMRRRRIIQVKFEIRNGYFLWGNYFLYFLRYLIQIIEISEAAKITLEEKLIKEFWKIFST